MKELAAQVHEPLVLLEALHNRWEAAAAAGPVLVLLDGLERADQLAQFVLRSLPLRTVSFPIVWVLVGRTAPDSVLNDLVAARAGHDAVERMELQPLSAEAILEIAHDRLGAPLQESAAELLLRVDSNPLLAMQVIDTLTSTSGRTKAALAPVAASVSRQVAQTSHRTLRDLSPRAVEMLRVPAVLSRPASPRDVQDLTGLSSVGAAAVVDEAIDAGVLDQRDAKIAFRYPATRIWPSRRGALCTASVLCSWRRPVPTVRWWPSMPQRASNPARPVRGDPHAVGKDLAAATPQAAGELAVIAFHALRPTDPAFPALGEQCVRVLGLGQRCDDALTVGDLVLAQVDDGEFVGRIELMLARALWLAGRWDA